MGMHARNEARPLRESDQQGRPTGLDVPRQTCGDFVVDVVDELVHLGDDLRPGRGQTDLERAPVASAALAANPVDAFKGVDEPDHDVAVDAQEVGQGLLCVVSAAGEVAHQADCARCHTQWSQGLGEGLGGMRPHLQQQKGQGARVAGRVR
jgi:hypothetical protein